MEWTHPELDRLHQAIVEAYTLDGFKRLLQFELGKDLSYTTVSASMSSVVFDTIMSAQREGWLSDLVTALIRANPGNKQLQLLAPTSPVRSVDFAVVAGDVFTFYADILALKYAQDFYGVDRRVAKALDYAGVSEDSLKPRVGDYQLTATRGALRTPQVLFVGVPELSTFKYGEIRDFSSSVIQILAQDDSASHISHIAMTLHGANYGLDEIEALFSLMAGSVQAIALVPAFQLHRISIVERDPSRVRRLGRALRHNLERSGYNDFDFLSEGDTEWLVRLRLASKANDRTPTSIGELPGTKSENKPRIFVAMPFREELADLFEYGIQQPTRDLQFLCERVDNEVFTGDILDRVKKNINEAAAVIAVLDGANPNVYLEVGYAWGRGRPTILIANEAEELPFDVRGHRCLKYRRIKQVEQELKDHLRGLNET
jgi:hypothetical protein